MRGRPDSARRPRGQGGFSLIELLMTMIIFSIFMTGLYAFLFSGMRTVATQRSESLADAQARMGVDRLVNDVRQAISPDGNVTAPVSYVDAGRMVLYSAVNNRTAGIPTTPRPQQVQYQLVGTQLIRSSVDPVGATPPYSYGPYTTATVVADGVSACPSGLFTVWSLTGAQMTLPVAQPKQIAGVGVCVRLTQSTGYAATTTEIATSATLRNPVPLGS